jgi:tripartite-type tricarboxylate transporter receptor subunit TctC
MPALRRSSCWHLSRRALVATPLVALLARRACAAYPERSIRLIVPFTAGGGVDGVARPLGRALMDGIGVSVVIDNRGGAGGVIGMDAVAHAPPDGYTLLLSHSGFTAMPGLYRDLPFDPVRDFAGIVTAASGAYILAANPGVPFRSVATLIAYAKANPGKVAYASAGTGSTSHLAAEFFKRAAAVDLLHIPYKGAAPALTDVVGGQVQIMFAPAVASLPLAASGKLAMLAVTAPQRSRLAPDVPTVGETLPGFDVTGWYGLAAPAGTPAAAVARINAEVNRALATADFVAQLAQQGLEPVGGPPEEAAARIASDVVRWTRIIREAGIKAQ